MNTEELLSKAAKALENSYSPYSQLKVGAALLSKRGKVYTGCNIENASFGATDCAERTAFFKAISEGERQFEAIAITAVNKDGKEETAAPCGICRQVMAEFCGPDFRIVLKQNGEIKVYTLSQLLPNAFNIKQI